MSEATTYNRVQAGPFDTYTDWGVEPNIGLDHSKNGTPAPRASPWPNTGSAPPPSASALSGSGVKKPVPTLPAAAPPAHSFVRF